MTDTKRCIFCGESFPAHLGKYGCPVCETTPDDLPLPSHSQTDHPWLAILAALAYLLAILAAFGGIMWMVAHHAIVFHGGPGPG